MTQGTVVPVSVSPGDPVVIRDTAMEIIATVRKILIDFGVPLGELVNIIEAVYIPPYTQKEDPYALVKLDDDLVYIYYNEGKLCFDIIRNNVQKPTPSKNLQATVTSILIARMLGFINKHTIVSKEPEAKAIVPVCSNVRSESQIKTLAEYNQKTFTPQTTNKPKIKRTALPITKEGASCSKCGMTTPLKKSSKFIFGYGMTKDTKRTATFECPNCKAISTSLVEHV